VALDPETKTHPLVIDHIPALGDVPKVSSHARAEDEALFALLRKLSKTFGTRDLIEEFVACSCFPVRAGWTIFDWLTEDRWIEGIPIPDFVSIFNLRADREFSFLVSFRAEANAHFVAYVLCFFDLAGVDPVVIESRADEMVGPVSRGEYKSLVSHLSGVRRNRVFHSLGLSAPQRAAELKIVEGQGVAPAHALEKAKALE